MAEADFVSLVPACKVHVDGAPLNGSAGARLTRVGVRLDADLFGQCSLTFDDPDLAIMNGDTFQSGTPVEVKIGFGSKLTKVFEGEVTAIEPCFYRDLPPSLKVVCHESLHRLALSPATRALNEVDDKEIVAQIARDHGLTAEAPSGTKQHHLQSNVTDAVMLRRLAQKSGNTLRIEGKKLIVGPPKKGEEIPLEPGSMLRKLKVRISSQQQVHEVTVHGWDPKAKREIVGKATPQGDLGKGARDYGKGHSLAIASHEPAPADVATAEAMAKGRLQKLAELFVVAQGEMIGDPRIVPGAMLAVDKIDAGVDGSYRVDHAEHSFTKHGYLTKFRAVWVAKKQPPKPAKAPPARLEREPPPPDLHLIHVELKTIGGTPLVNHPVRLLDPATGEPASQILTTDTKGILKTEAPGPGKYRIEILDRNVDPSAGPDQFGADLAVVLACRFVGTDGGPLANEEIDVKCGEDKLKLTTDADGRIDAPATHTSYELTVRGETFVAHAVPASQREPGLHVFVVGEEKYDQHVLAVQVRGIGDTPLVHGKVRVLDPDNGETVTDWLETDDEGYLRTTVPDGRTYRIEIGDGALEHEGPEEGGNDPPARLVFQLVTPDGSPLAGQAVQATTGEDKVELMTDEEGRVDAPAHLGSYSLKVGEETFAAHAVLASDAEKSDYRFVVGEEQHDRHLLSVIVRGIGDTPLVRHRVRVLDPDNGEAIGEWLETDDQGLLQTEVPDDRTYRIEIEDRDPADGEAPGIDPERSGGMLVCVFTDASGAPIANETVDAGEMKLQTDANGRLEAGAGLGPYELKVRGKTFNAHGLPAEDAEKEENIYRFVVEEG